MLPIRSKDDHALATIEAIRTTVRTARNRVVTLRALAPNDEPIIVDLYQKLSAQAWWLRFFTPKPADPAALIGREAQRLVHAAGHVLIATVRDGRGECCVAVAQLPDDHADPTQRELAVVVRDDYQQEGIGTAVCRLLGAQARQHGVRQIRANILAENRAALRLIRRLCLPYSVQRYPGELLVLLDLA